MISDEPAIGEFSSILLKDEENNRSVLNVTWKDVPPSYNGRSFDFKFRSCADSGRYCSTESTTVKIEVKQRKAPQILRQNWDVGTIKYLNFSQREYSSVLVRDGDGLNSIARVEVTPKSMQKYVQWNNGNLYMEFDKEGIYQFNLLATSEYNLQSSESFVVEVFSKNRSKTLYFTDSTRDKEAQFFKNAFSQNGIELMNPTLQVLNERNLSGRETLVLGTSVLMDPNLSEAVEKAMENVENVIIASPLLTQMPKTFVEKLSVDYGVSISGRYSDINDIGKPKLEDMIINTPKAFETPKNYVSLSLKATAESYDPIIFSVGVETKNCTNAFEISNESKTKRYTIGVVCKRGANGRLAILGTEFADIRPTEADTTIPYKWFEDTLNAELTVIVIEGSK